MCIFRMKYIIKDNVINMVWKDLSYVKIISGVYLEVMWWFCSNIDLWWNGCFVKGCEFEENDGNLIEEVWYDD